ncbi:She9p KNAG_0C04600 [Huiozyma naganishii CBS 8797]|uniref:Sensitive to high expression protein 9, mitochondrial n=1 Tax=Huiozyma naganishii (strain ATCC MYA-139 / BCRC 22969 / CBS 8797 / KCTC 17520 / NBRC 10181 / NCYC 3082 / Yp74L-3) TaxID=1071383 RepID=J7RX00_HUIN7|nr:hypothetical protein KNAG_0C04600 [Kazachstania naganishii CBS 8797]CCK69562.1 hypothetical protein KNAG_0C04600 [Kazachstania naganishii CBS 8797]
MFLRPVRGVKWQLATSRVRYSVNPARILSTGHSLNKQSNDQNAGEEKSKENEKGTLWEALQPKISVLKDRAEQVRGNVRSSRKQISDNLGIMKKSIQKANFKIAEQDRERQDSKLNYDIDAKTNSKIEGLPSDRESHRNRLSRKLTLYMDSLQETIFTATKVLNDVTGYSSIQQLRESIVTMERQLEEVKLEVKKCKTEYNDAIQTRIQSQREVNNLLQRKSSWSTEDLERFTQLYKDDTINSRRVEDLKVKLAHVESREDQLHDDLYRAILTRYHEEQIWSDKIRRTSTWGTFTLMGINICLFLILQLLLEPWKRRRLTRSFEDKFKAALEAHSVEQSAKFENLATKIDNTGGEPVNIEEIGDQKTELSSEETIQANEQEYATDMLAAPSKNTKLAPLHDFATVLLTLFHKIKQFYSFSPKHSVELSTTEFYLFSTTLMILTSLVTLAAL